jgi:hypothetical protein
MYRGTTPTLTFTLPFSTENIDNAYITFAQYGTVKIDKPLQDCKCDDNKLVVRLTQEETLSLRCDCAVEMQISIRAGENVMRSQIISTTVERILKDGEIP